MKLIVLVGVAGVGKSSMAKIIMGQEDGEGIILSSDDYRLKLFGSLKEGNKKGNSAIVFQHLHEDLKNEIERGEYDFIIYDATNTSRKRRRSLYRNVKNWSKGEVSVDINYFSVPLKRIYENNFQREMRDSEKAVPRGALRDMYQNMQVPRVGVDCDNFLVVGIPMFDYQLFHNILSNDNFAEAIYESSIGSMGGELSRILESHECEPYHLEDIDTHINMCIKEAESTKWHNSDLIRIAEFHDLGKALTKKMVERNGVKKATYRGHAELSANYYLNFVHFMDGFDLKGQVDVLEAIRQHMSAHQGLGEKNIRNNKLNENVLKLCEAFAEIDSKSRIVGEGV